MRRRQFVRLALGSGSLLALGGSPASVAPQHWARRALVGFGTTLTLQAGHDDRLVLDRALDESVATLRAIERQMSLFDPASDLSRLNRDGRLERPPAELLAVLQRALDISAASGGAFDVTVQPLWEAWARAGREQRLPRPAELEAARRCVDWRGVHVRASEVRFARAGMGVTLNGIAQGHAADRVREVLQRHGVRDALVDAGEWSPMGRHPEGRPWALAVPDPRQPDAWIARLLTDGRCVATSADHEASFTADRRHHHIFDPRTGRSPADVASVTVLAHEAILADALTKVLFVAGSTRTLEVARAWGVDVLVVDKSGRRIASPGMPLG